MSDLTVDKARITASFWIAFDGQVVELRTPTYVDTNERGVLRTVYVRDRRQPDAIAQAEYDLPRAGPHEAEKAYRCPVCAARIVGGVPSCGYDCEGRL